MDAGSSINYSTRILVFVYMYAGFDTWCGENMSNRSTLIDICGFFSSYTTALQQWVFFSCPDHFSRCLLENSCYFDAPFDSVLASE